VEYLKVVAAPKRAVVVVARVKAAYQIGALAVVMGVDVTNLKFVAGTHVVQVNVVEIIVFPLLNAIVAVQIVVHPTKLVVVVNVVQIIFRVVVMNVVWTVMNVVVEMEIAVIRMATKSVVEVLVVRPMNFVMMKVLAYVVKEITMVQKQLDRYAQVSSVLVLKCYGIVMQTNQFNKVVVLVNVQFFVVGMTFRQYLQILVVANTTEQTGIVIRRGMRKSGILQ
jgi:hypothetical protein